MGISSTQPNVASQGVPSGSPSTSNKAPQQEAVASKSSSAFLSAAAALGGRLVTGAVTLFRGSSHVLGALMVALGNTLFKQLKKQLKEQTKANDNSSPPMDPLKDAKACVVAGAQTKETLQAIQQKYQEKKNELLKEFQKKYPQKLLPDSSHQTLKPSSSAPADPIYKGAAKTPEDDARANDTTIFQNIINQSFDDPKKAERAVNFLAKKLDKFIDSTIKGAVEKNPAIDASKTANEIAITVLNA